MENNNLTPEENPAPITSVKIDDGTKRVPFINQDNEVIGVLRFRPADFGIITRYNEYIEKWESIWREMEEDVDGDDIGEVARKVTQGTRAVYDFFDYILGGPVSGEIFDRINPFNPVGTDGALFCEIVLDTMTALFEQEFSVQLAKRAEREKKMTKYRPPNRQERRAAKK